MERAFKLRRFPPVQILTYVLARTIIMVVAMFSPRFVRKIGRALGRLMFAVDFKHRRIAAKNVSQASGMPREPRQVGRFVRRVYEHFGVSLVELLQLPRMLQQGALARHVSLENFALFDQARARGRGAIAVIGHLGNWECGGLAVTMAGYPLNSVARPIENPFLDRYLNRFRTLTGQRIIPKYNALRAMADVLKRNEILVILADQDMRHGGLFVPFFGRPASTVRSPALLALRHKAPIIPVNVYRDEAGIHHAILTEPIEPGDYRSHEDPVAAITAAFTARLESFIREHPTQWMWLHHRWKTATRALREHPESKPEETADAEA